MFMFWISMICLTPYAITAFVLIFCKEFSPKTGMKTHYISDGTAHTASDFHFHSSSLDYDLHSCWSLGQALSVSWVGWESSPQKTQPPISHKEHVPGYSRCVWKLHSVTGGFHTFAINYIQIYLHRFQKSS